MQNYYSRVGRVESQNKDNATNPMSSASGRYQFLDGTYLSYAQRMMPNASRQELMAAKNDPNMQLRVMEQFTNDNAANLRKNGFEDNHGNLYLSHFLGGGGALKVLRADPNTPMSQLFDEKVIKANPFLANMTASGVQSWANQKMNGGGDASQAINTAMGTTDNTQQLPPGVMSFASQGDQVPANTVPQDTSYRDSVLQGGPMGLFGMGQKGYDWGNALIGAGSAIASISSPTQGAAIAGLRRDRAKDIASQYDANTGTWYHYDKLTGEYSQSRDPNWLNNLTAAHAAKKKIDADYKPPSDKEIERFGAHQQFLDQNNGLIEDLSYLNDYIGKNKDATGWMGRVKSLGTSAFDGSGMLTQDAKDKLAKDGLLSSPEQQDFFSRLERVQQRLIVQEQLRQKGVQTEGDALRYGKANFDSLSKLSGEALQRAIEDRLRDAHKDQSRVYGNYEGIAKRYQPGGDARFQPDATGIDKYREQSDISRSRLTDLERVRQERQQAATQQPQGQAQPQQRKPLTEHFSSGTPKSTNGPPVSPKPAQLGNAAIIILGDGSGVTPEGQVVSKDMIDKARKAGALKE